MSLRILDASARDGALWVSNAFALFLKRPLAFSALFALFLFAALFLLLLPYVGAVLLLMALPLLGLGFMIASRSALEGGTVHAGQLVESCAAATLRPGAAQAASAAVRAVRRKHRRGDAGQRCVRRRQLRAPAGRCWLRHRDAARQKELDALLADDALLIGLMLRLGGTALLSVPFWHAPALVWWQGQGVAQSLFSSTVACWRNRGAFAVYALAGPRPSSALPSSPAACSR